MNLLCIFPITNIPENYPKIMKYFEVNIAMLLQKLGAEIEIKFAGTDYRFVSTNESIPIGSKKGEGILECIKNCTSPPDFVIMCDGSGAIPYNYIVKIFQELTSDSSIYGVMANRGENKSISEERLLIERFEIYVLKKHYDYREDIPDGQCGLWGYRASIKDGSNNKKIKLTAKSYDIELDLLGELLKNNLKFSFINIDLPKRDAPSSFTYDNNLKKMQFLLEKYEDIKPKLKDYITLFENTQEYLKIVENKSIKETWDKYLNDLYALLNNI